MKNSVYPCDKRRGSCFESCFFRNNISEEYLMTWENIQDAFGENAR